MSSESEVDKQIRLWTINEHLAIPKISLEEYNRLATMKHELLASKMNPQKKPFRKSRMFPIILVSLLAFSCIVAGALVSTLDVHQVPQPHHYIVSTGTMIQSPITGSGSSANTSSTDGS